jgi:uncharacterized protein
MGSQQLIGRIAHVLHLSAFFTHRVPFWNLSDVRNGVPCLVTYFQGVIMTVSPTSQTSSKRVPIGTSVGIPPRRVRFDFNQQTVPAYFFDNSAFKSTLILAMSATFPEGELFFVRSVKQFREQIQNTRLSAEISGFIGQEALHSQAHLAFDAAAEQHGFSLKALEHMHGESMKLTWKLFSPMARLGFTAGVEHLTAVLTELLLKDQSILERMAPEVRNLFLWHSIEENEHKSVAFDVFQAMGGSYRTRALMMAYGVMGFIGTTIIFQTKLLRQDPRGFSLRDYMKGLNFFFGRKGKFLPVIPMLFDYFKPSFHPSQHNTDFLIEQWRDSLFGINGALQSQLIH